MSSEIVLLEGDVGRNFINEQPVRLVRTGWCWKPAGTGKTSQHSSIQPAHMQPTGNPAHFKQMARTAQDVSSPEKNGANRSSIQWRQTHHPFK